MNDEVPYRSMLDTLHEGIYFVSSDRTITFWNKGAERITGFSSTEMLGRHCYDNLLNHVDDDGHALCLTGCPLHATIGDGLNRENRLYLHHKDGHRLPFRVRTTRLIESGRLIGAVEMFLDAESSFFGEMKPDELMELAFRDQLTGLANRRELDRQLKVALLARDNFNQTLALLFADIDHFKQVNDSYGHAVGDEVLRMVSRSMVSALRSTDLVGRWGGEEFLCLLRLSAPEHLDVVAEKVRMLVEHSALRLPDKEIRVTISIGGCCSLPDEPLNDWVQRTDRLLYASKEGGRNRVTLS